MTVYCQKTRGFLVNYQKIIVYCVKCFWHIQNHHQSSPIITKIITNHHHKLKTQNSTVYLCRVCWIKPPVYELSRLNIAVLKEARQVSWYFVTCEIFDLFQQKSLKIHIESFIKSSARRSSRPEVFCIKGVLETSQNSQENTCAKVSFLIKLQVSGLQLY